jgi:hypothetical protein
VPPSLRDASHATEHLQSLLASSRLGLLARPRLITLGSTLDPILLRTAVRRGAASCQAVLRSCPGSASARVVAAEPSSVAERRRRCNPSEVGPPSRRRRRRGRRGCPAAGHAVRRSVRRADVRPPDHADGQCPGDRCPRDRCDPGVRTDRCPVSAAAASALSGPRWIPDVGAPGQATFGGLGSTCRCGPQRACAWLARGSTADLGCRFAGAPAAAPRSPPGRPRELVQRQGAGRLAGSTRRSGCSQVPRRCVLGRLPA